ncbi:hypothetical protein PFISCL1PPCAC_13362 [Pristionchus fissidentatus]|uniref:Exportin-4 n=1 Tax=Pristionchus fissidentatus TaxID=1538716 RepID=A0AAV5VVH3_9BILA|nr:hypothetical protein PFISCL1PPCAC_13362 [Pristionchus fissidentatus]
MDLERAAETILAPPSAVTAEDRKAAEAIFTELKGALTVEHAKNIMASSSHPFVLHQVGQAMGEFVLREWPLLEGAEVESVYKMLVEFTATKDNLPVYVVAEFLKSTAMIIKRGILDKKTGDPEVLYETIRGLLAHPEARMQAIGCQLISSLCEQFSSSWRNSKFSITWDFHLAAKSEFEKTGLRRLLEMAVSNLYNLVERSDILSNAFERRFCEKFLEVAESAFSWNFSARIFRRLFSMNQNSTSFRPPKSWADLLSNEAFFLVFFKLHAKCRSDENLSVHSLGCLVQLASLAGEVMSDDFSQHFVHIFTDNLLSLFPQGPAPHETDAFATIVHRLFMYRPVQTLIRLPEELRTRFFSYISQYVEHLTGAALSDAIRISDHSKHSALSQLYDAWSILLRGKWRVALPEDQCAVFEESMVAGPTWTLISAFFNATQSAPMGSRPKEEEEGGDEDDDDEMKDDRILYADLLTPLSSMALYSLPRFLETLTSTLRSRLREFSAMADGSADSSRLPEWQEDMHWLMLIAATSLVGEDLDGSCHVQVEVYDHSVKLCGERGGPFPPEARDSFLQQCIEHPTAPRDTAAGHVDPFLILVGELFAWCSLEHQLLSSASIDMISPELCRSTAFALKRILNATSSIPEPDDTEAVHYPLLPTSGPVADLIVNFFLTKTFTTLHKFSGERRLCSDSVTMLESLVESHAATLAASPALFALLGEMDLARCPVRAQLMKVLVFIGAAANSDELRKNMFNQILNPLTVRYGSVLSQHRASPNTTQVDSDLIDLLQCFDGVARASQPQSASTLFKVVQPVLETCPDLVRTSSSAAVVTAVLTLMQDVTTKVSIYIDDKEDSLKLYMCLLQTVDAYRSTHVQRFVGMNSDDEEKAADLVLFMEILSNVLSNDILESPGDRQLSGSQVAMTSLEMLLCVMSESLLQHPEVALKFYRLLLYLTEFCPESLAFINDQLLNAMCECLKAGLTSKFGTEITSVCLESLAEVAVYFGAHRDKCTESLVGHFHTMMPMAFEACLENSAEASIFSEACYCLYALICFDKDYFNSFAQELLQRKSNAKAATKLGEAFARLFPEEPKMGRRERLQFRQRMEKFLGEIQGLLWLH